MLLELVLPDDDTFPLELELVDDEPDEDPEADDDTLPDDDEETLPLEPPEDDVLDTVAPPDDVEEPPVDEVLLTLPLEVDPPLLLLDPPLVLLDVEPPLDVEEITMLPLDPELPPPKKPPPKPPLPPKKPPLPPTTTGTPPPPPTNPSATGIGVGWLAIVSTAGAQAVVVVVVTTRLPRAAVRAATRVWTTRFTSFLV